MTMSLCRGAVLVIFITQWVETQAATQGTETQNPPPNFIIQSGVRDIHGNVGESIKLQLPHLKNYEAHEDQPWFNRWNNNYGFEGEPLTSRETKTPLKDQQNIWRSTLSANRVVHLQRNGDPWFSKEWVEMVLTMSKNVGYFENRKFQYEGMFQEEGTLVMRTNLDTYLTLDTGLLEYANAAWCNGLDVENGEITFQDTELEQRFLDHFKWILDANPSHNLYRLSPLSLKWLEKQTRGMSNAGYTINRNTPAPVVNIGNILRTLRYNNTETTAFPKWHWDIRDRGVRSFTMIVILSPRKDYDGGNFQYMLDGKVYSLDNLKEGDAFIFSKEVWHRVTKVTGGERRILAVEISTRDRRDPSQLQDSQFDFGGWYADDGYEKLVENMVTHAIVQWKVRGSKAKIEAEMKRLLELDEMKCLLDTPNTTDNPNPKNPGYLGNRDPFKAMARFKAKLVLGEYGDDLRIEPNFFNDFYDQIYVPNAPNFREYLTHLKPYDPLEEMPEELANLLRKDDKTIKMAILEEAKRQIKVQVKAIPPSNRNDRELTWVDSCLKPSFVFVTIRLHWNHIYNAKSLEQFVRKYLLDDDEMRNLVNDFKRSRGRSG